MDSDDLKMEVDEVADWAADVDDQIDGWRLQNYEEIKTRLNETLMETESKFS